MNNSTTINNNTTSANPEVFKVIKGFPTYAISNLGTVKNSKGEILTACDVAGYKQVRLKVSRGLFKGLLVHRLVAQAFLGMDLGNRKLTAGHINGQKGDNRLENITIQTYSQNMKDYYKTLPKGVTNRIPELVIKQIRNAYAKFGKSTYSLAQQYGISQQHIVHIVNNNKRAISV